MAQNRSRHMASFYCHMALSQAGLIVFVGQHFGIFPSHEVFMLANVPVHDIAKKLNITRDQVYAKYTQGILSEKS